MKKLCFTLVALLAFQTLSAQLWQKSDTLSRKRITTLAVGETTGYAVSLIGLNELWYKGFDRTRFHFFDDHKSWLQIDKAGHFYSAYYISQAQTGLLRWAGMSQSKATLYGSSIGFLVISSIELLDGFSVRWGASPTDMIANGLGSSLYFFQEKYWQEQRIVPKYSFYPNEYAQFRPDVFGTGVQRLVKDYNACTLWLSFNLQAFTKARFFPKWLNVAVGYGADGMIGAYENPDEINGKPIPHFERRRQFYLSLDIDFTRIKTRSKFLRHTFRALNLLKVPFPAIEFSGGKTYFHPLHY